MRPYRLLKKPVPSEVEGAHLRRPILRMGTPLAQALVAAYLQYASLGLPHSALHLDLFEQPAQERVFQQPAEGLAP